MSLALNHGPAGPPANRTSPGHGPAAPMTLDEVWWAAERLAESKMLPGVSTPQQAFTLMLLCQADGLHPIVAMRRYHVIQGRPAVRSDYVQGELLNRGWTITPTKMTRTEARAIFKHPAKQPDGCELGVTLDDYRFLASKDNWKNHPDDMLWARLMTKGCRRFDPGIIAGLPTRDELEDTIYTETFAGQHAVAAAEASRAVAAADVRIPGQPPGEAYDDRTYRMAAKEACDWAGMKEPELHKHLSLRAVQKWPDLGPPPRSMTPAIQLLTKLYQSEREWVRQGIAGYCGEGKAAEVETVMAATPPPAEDQADGEIDYEHTGDATEDDTEAGSRG